MNRRNFLQSMIGGLAASAAVRQWPFRVYSFPTRIVPYRSLPDSIFVNTPWIAMNKIPVDWEAAELRAMLRGGHRHGRWSPLYAPEYRS